MDYIGQCPECKRIVAWILETCPSKDEEVSRLIRDNLNVLRMTTEAARAGEWGHAKDCSRKPKPQAAIPGL